jgi:Anti-sigma-K factor rskA, C-terminal/Putative zinc-finger
VSPPDAEGCDGIQDLLAAFALDSLDPDEAALVENHLANCPRCRQEVDQHRETVGLLAAAGGTAPEPVWDRIAGAIGRQAPPDVPSVPRLVPAARPPARSRWVWPLQAVAVAAAAVIVVLVVVGTARIGSLNHQVHQLRAANGGLAEALVDPAARHLTLTTTAAGQPIGQLIILPSGASYLVGSRLPALVSARTYQLWSMVNGRAVSVSLLGAHPVTVAFRVDPAAPPQAYLITIEPAGGVVAPTTSPVAKATA